MDVLSETYDYIDSCLKSAMDQAKVFYQEAISYIKGENTQRPKYSAEDNDCDFISEYLD